MRKRGVKERRRRHGKGEYSKEENYKHRCALHLLGKSFRLRFILVACKETKRPPVVGRENERGR